MYSYGPPHMAKQRQNDQLEHTYEKHNYDDIEFCIGFIRNNIEFVLPSRYYFDFRANTFGKRNEPSYPTIYGLNGITVLLGEWLVIKQPIKVDMPLNKETKPK